MQINRPHILLVDDDLELCSLLAEFLDGEGFKVSMVHDGESALELFKTPPSLDVIVLDIMMPGISGIEVLRALRSQRNIPVIMLTGRGEDIDRIIGLELGADDYLAKPCNPRELAARIRAVLRRTLNPVNKSSTAMVTDYIAHGLRLKPEQRQLFAFESAVDLTSAEFNTLNILMQSMGIVISKAELTEKVLQRKLTAYDRSIDVHISRLRQKLNGHGIAGNIIKTIRGQGYLFVKDDS